MLAPTREVPDVDDREAPSLRPRQAALSLVEQLIPPAKRGGGKRTVNMREGINGVMYVLSTGCHIAHGAVSANPSPGQRH